MASCPFGHGTAATAADAAAAPLPSAATATTVPTGESKMEVVATVAGAPGTTTAKDSTLRAAGDCYYGDYLQLGRLLSSQHLRSVDAGRKAHDEMLFIITHQAYELWFKQILWELDSIVDIFSKDYVDERLVGVAVGRLHRVTEIQRILNEQLVVLETMSPLDFLDFRDFLVPASGFQSRQFRLIENKLGLPEAARVVLGGQHYCSYLRGEDLEVVKSSMTEANLYNLVEKWLERTPFVSGEDFDWWESYAKAVKDMFDREEVMLDASDFDDATKEAQRKQLQGSRDHFQSIISQEQHESLVERGSRRLSHKASQAALLILLYKDEPILEMPNQLLNSLLSIDELMTAWRYRHALMVHRMLGVKLGTGGSSGYHYLRTTAQRYQIFADIFNMSTFLIPRAALPELPARVRASLGFASQRS